MRTQRKESELARYFKMIDFYQNCISNITIKSLKNDEAYVIQGRKAFAEMKLQLKKLLEIVRKVNEKEKLGYGKKDEAAIAYLLFFYGINGAWRDFLREQLKGYGSGEILVEKVIDYINAPKYNKEALGRTNQTDLSAYYRNMYNAIKLIDESKLLNDDEKYDYVKILRAQLSNPELYILFFSLFSPFGKNWNESGYIVKYSFLQNIPPMYCDGYEPTDYFENNEYV